MATEIKHGKILYTIGYEGRSLEELIACLKTSNISVVLDVREIPISRKMCFSKSKLKSKLEDEELGYIHIRTKLWRLAHSNIENLDEREIQVTHNSLRHSYSIVSIISLIVIAFITLSVPFSFFTLTHRGHYSFGLIVLIMLNYVTHKLPASIIAWSEKEVLVV